MVCRVRRTISIGVRGSRAQISMEADNDDYTIEWVGGSSDLNEQKPSISNQIVGQYQWPGLLGTVRIRLFAFKLW